MPLIICNWGDEMFTLNDDLSIYATRGDIVFFAVTAEQDGKPYLFKPGDVVRIKVYGKKDAEDVVLQKDFPVTDYAQKVQIFLTKDDMKIGDVISKHKDYWYEIVLNDDTLPQTIIGYDEDGAKLFRLFPEGDDIPEYIPKPEEIPVVDDKLDMTSTRPIQNQAVAKAVANLQGRFDTVFEAVSDRFVTPQMFGAIGDGEADDTEALQKALDSGNSVMLATGTYRITDTLTVPYGCTITGDKNSIILPECDTVFHLQEKDTLSGFEIQVRSENVLTVFDIDDNSTNTESMLEILIDGVTVTHSAEVMPDMYTVCHIHSNAKGLYNVTVRGCTFDNYPAGGYVARVYAEGADKSKSWVSTILFDGNWTRAFKWHYFFDKSDKEFVNEHNNSCIVTNCTAQCNPVTNGFVFINNNDSVTFKNNITWDWGSSSSGSTNCHGRPYVIGPNIQPSGDEHVFTYHNHNNDIVRADEICRYDGTAYTNVNYCRQDIVSYLGGQYNQGLIPKYVGLDRAKVIHLHKETKQASADTRVRFYWCDVYGITYVSINRKSKTVNVSQPLYSNIVFAMDTIGNIYVYSKTGGKLPPNTGIMTLPVVNSSRTFAMENSATGGYERTPNFTENIDTCSLESVPEGATELPIRLAQPAYVYDDEGIIYNLTVTKDDSGNNAITIKKAWEPQNEEV